MRGVPNNFATGSSNCVFVSLRAISRAIGFAFSYCLSGRPLSAGTAGCRPSVTFHSTRTGLKDHAVALASPSTGSPASRRRGGLTPAPSWVAFRRLQAASRNGNPPIHLAAEQAAAPPHTRTPTGRRGEPAASPLNSDAAQTSNALPDAVRHEDPPSLANHRIKASRLLAKAGQRFGQRAPQSVHLIDQVQDHVEPLVVDAHIVLEIVDETRAGEVHFGELLLVGRARRADPGLADPDFQGGPIDLRLFKKLPLVDHRLTSPCGDRSRRAASSRRGRFRVRSRARSA